MAEAKKTRTWSEPAVDALVAVVGLAVLALLVWRFVLPFVNPPAPPPIPMAAELVDTRLDGVVDVDFSAAERTALVYVREECDACIMSLPFYRRLTAQAADGARIVFAGPATEPRLGAFLASEGVVPDEVVLMPPSPLSPFSATPTLVLVDSAGVVTDAWIGTLPPPVETQILATLFDG